MTRSQSSAESKQAETLVYAAVSKLLSPLLYMQCKSKDPFRISRAFRAYVIVHIFGIGESLLVVAFWV